MGPTWDPSGADRTQVGPMLAPWTLLSGVLLKSTKMVSLQHEPSKVMCVSYKNNENQDRHPTLNIYINYMARLLVTFKISRRINSMVYMYLEIETNSTNPIVYALSWGDIPSHCPLSLELFLKCTTCINIFILLVTNVSVVLTVHRWY